MQTSILDYDLPESAIARFPAEPRDHSRLLVFWRSTGRIQHARFYQLPEFLTANDMLLANDTRVLLAKLTLTRSSGRKFQGLFLEELSAGTWRVMLRSNGQLVVGEELSLTGNQPPLRWTVKLVSRDVHEPAQWLVKLSPVQSAVTVLQHVGEVPLPPYIEKARHKHPLSSPAGLDDRRSYQTIYAATPGALAAPTAGLHFTPDLMQRLNAHGVTSAFVTLNVGLGTFLPIRSENLSDHSMHQEKFHIPAATVEAIRRHRERAGRLVLVGTTVVRTLESAASTILGDSNPATDISGSTDLFIAPGFHFQLTDSLITNFHLPKSTLLALVAALIGITRLQELYALALREGYRFYSYGDAMLILP